MNILFAASEAFPFIKTGGLGDVVHSLPVALGKLGDDVRLVLPAYRDVLAAVDSIKEVGYRDLPGIGVTHRVRILRAHQEELGDYLYLIDVPTLFDRPGNPYVHSDGFNWPDNAERFTVFSRAVAYLAKGVPGSHWIPDVVHCHDWQTGMVPAFISMTYPRPKTVFTIHNLAYDGHFSHDDFTSLALPPEWWSLNYVEFYGGFSMLKAGMIFSDHVTTVSPTYAREICTPEFGYRFEGVLNHLGDKLVGILNGIDLDIWNPMTDSHIFKNYGYQEKTAGKSWVKNKLINKINLLKNTGLADNESENSSASAKSMPLLGFIGRLVEQKGVDLIMAMLPRLFETTDVKMVILGSGHMHYETGLKALAEQYPTRLHFHIGYSEDLAHQIEAGCDMFIMPSRFEPCGLNQMYSLHYGTPPVVSFTGGLADTVTDATPMAVEDKTANGFVFYDLNADALLAAINRALELYRKPKQWQQVCETAMQQELGWEASAKKYQELYMQ
ncbi:MAG: glycogen synthase GlgA [Gammaproteobacteria bacterium]|nr:glycogen synthase GlgA [Gammaproteobacteria bacterium]